MSRNRGGHSYDHLARPESLLLRLQGKLFGSTSWPTALSAGGSHQRGANRFGWHIMGLSKFPDTLSPVILPAALSAMGALVVRFLWSAAVSFPSPFDKRLSLHSHEGLVMVDLLNNFLNPLKLFLAKESNFTKSLQMRMEGVRRER